MKKNYIGKRIRNFVVTEKTDRKKKRSDGRNFYLYKCQCDCGTSFESHAGEFDWKFGCNICSKQHHYNEASKSRKSNTKLVPPRHTTLSKLSPESKNGMKGSYANYLVNWIKQTAVKRNLSWNIDHVEVFKLIQEPCHYCGIKVNFPETRNGLDRTDNTKGYIIDNVVSCCYPCNIAKREMSLSQFKEYIIRVYHHFVTGSSNSLPDP